MNSLSPDSKKALINNIGEAAGTEIANLIAQLVHEVEELRRTKVSVTRLAPVDDKKDYNKEPI
jgi:hypothetical protein